MEAALSPRQLRDWAAYAEVSPIGPERDDERAGLLAWAVFQSPRRKQLKLAAFVPKYGPPPPPPTPKQLAAKLRALAEHA